MQDKPKKITLKHGYLTAILVCAVTALAATPLRHFLDLANIVMLFLLVVFLIALKLAQFEFIKKQGGVLPILLFDDVFDKLDETRVAKIVQMIDDKVFGQIFISDTHPERTEAIVKATHQSYTIFKM